jgi:hypothetical protein
MSCPTIVLRGQRAQVQVDGHQARRAVQVARRRRTRLVLLPAVDGVPLTGVSVGTLVDIEDENDLKPDARSIDVFGAEVVNIAHVYRGSHLNVEAVTRPGWIGDDPGWVDQVEALGTRVRYRAAALSRITGYHPRSYNGLSFDQLIVTLAVNCESDRLRLLEEDLLGQLRILDNALRRRLRGARRPHRRQSHVKTQASRHEEEAAEQVFPDDIQRVIDEGTRQGGGHTSEEAVRFIKGMRWVAPVVPPVDLVGAQAKLDAACYGMSAVKEQVLDYLASWEWRRQHEGTASAGKVLCMLGPPGVGKTAIAQVVSEVMGRTLIRLPMGGVDDVFLIGADQAYQHGRPGEIARRIRESGRHPSELVFLLDEIDKVPARATSAVPVLLAVLDSEQQAHFRDHFLDAVNIDLSNSVFICTANNLEDISPPLLDRLQPLVLPAYSRTEHIHIGTTHLLPRLRCRLRLDDEVQLASDVIPALVDGSPASPGMRQLQAQLETVMTRGLRLRMETGVSVLVSAQDALSWLATDNTARRPIGFRAADTSAK